MHFLKFMNIYNIHDEAVSFMGSIQIIYYLFLSLGVLFLLGSSVTVHNC